jgi:predicted HD phosphohydrolase
MAPERAAAGALEEVLALLAGSGSAPYIGEPLSQLGHALQCAALAAAAAAPRDVVAAALLHDVGHLCDPTAPQMPGLGALDHDRRGAAWLAARGFPDAVVDLVGGHVQAKRFLVRARPGYAARLSAASAATLALQGGAMDDQEVAAFERDPRRDDKLRLRAWDEQAKVAGLAVPPLESYRALLDGLIRR